MSESQLVSLGKFHTLSTAYISYEKMKELRWRDREPAKVLQNFIDRNLESFRFLGIEAAVSTRNFKPVVVLRTSEYVGSAPLFSPMTGKPVGDIVVTGRFGEDAGEIVAFLGPEVQPVFSTKLRLTQHTRVLPPLYLECVRFLETFREVHRLRWHKFKNVALWQRQPASSTDWPEYALRTAVDPNQQSTFLNRRNILSCNHTEWQQLCYVAQLCIDLLKSSAVPMRFRNAYRRIVRDIERLLEYGEPLAAKSLSVSMADPMAVRRLKEIGNKVLRQQSSASMAWRIDFNEVFERYVQHLMEEASRRVSAQLTRNPRYPISMSHHPSWSLRYLEPDMVVRRCDATIPVDAKYKSHLYNIGADSTTDQMTDTFRHDLHQILAYTTLSPQAEKRGILIYPATDNLTRRLTVSDRTTHTTIAVQLVGIPLSLDHRSATITSLARLLSRGS